MLMFLKIFFMWQTIISNESVCLSVSHTFLIWHNSIEFKILFWLKSLETNIVVTKSCGFFSFFFLATTAISTPVFMKLKMRGGVWVLALRRSILNLSYHCLALLTFNLTNLT